MNKEFVTISTEMLTYSGDISSSFDAAIPDKPEQVASSSNKIVYKTAAGT